MKNRRYGGKAVSGARRGMVLAVAVSLLTALPSYRLSAQETSLTVYQDGSVLVRRALPALARGASTVAFDLASTAVEAGSFMLLGEGAQLRTARVVQAAGAAAALRRSVGRDVDFWVQLPDTAYYQRGRVLSTEPLAIRIDGRVMYDMPGRPAFPDSLVQLAPRAELDIRAERAVQGARIAYLSSGLSWRAQINMVVPRVGGGPAEVSGMAVLENQGLAVRDAEVQLASGTIRRVSQQRPMPAAAPRAMRMEAMAAEGMAGDAAAEGVAETRLYTLPERLDLERGVTLSTTLFSRTSAQVERVFTIAPSGGVVEQWMDRADSNMHPAVTYRVRRPEGSPFGAMPTPRAVWRLLAPDADGRLQLVGEEMQGETPAGRDVDITTGAASDVIVDRVQTAFERRTEGLRRGEQETTASFRVTVRNSKDESITVNVLEFAPGRWEVLTSTVPAERISSSQFRFALPVAARGTAVLEYRVRARW